MRLSSRLTTPTMGFLTAAAALAIVAWFARDRLIPIAAQAHRQIPVPAQLRPTWAAGGNPGCLTERNLALNPTRGGTPSPLESSPGWGGGSSPWELVDGRHSYESWSHGLAFTGGHATAEGGPPYGAEAGPRQVTIDLGAPKHIERIVVWNHGVEHTPQDSTVEAWDGERWIVLDAIRTRDVGHEDGQGSGAADADDYAFAPVVASKIRYGFDNRGKNVLGTWNIHGWLYELEVFGCDSQG